MYKEKLNEYSKSVKNSFDKVDDLRVETQFESLKDWSELYNLEEVRNWFLSEQKRSKLSVQDIPLTECRGWHFNEDDGTIRHESGDFFYVTCRRLACYSICWPAAQPSSFLTANVSDGESSQDSDILPDLGWSGESFTCTSTMSVPKASSLSQTGQCEESEFQGPCQHTRNEFQGPGARKPQMWPTTILNGKI